MSVTLQVGTYKKMIIQLKKYWDKLFADGITVATSEKTITISPQRTNNIMEQFFRFLKRLFLRKNGITSLSNVLNTMLADVPLIRNLENTDYMAILLNGKATLEERFAEIDSEKIRKEIQKNCNHNKKLPKKIENIINHVDFPNLFYSLTSKVG